MRIRELNALARRLPHFERFAAIKMILLWVQVSAWVEAHEEPHLAPKPDNWDANPFHLLDQRSEFVGYLEQAVNPRLLARVDNWWKRVKFRAEWLWQMNIKGMTTESTLGALRELDEAEKSEPPSAGWYLTKTGLRKLDQSSPRRTAGDDQVG